MKYIAIVDDEFISNFRVDIKSNAQSYSDIVLVVTDKAGFTRGIGLKPLPKGHGRLIDEKEVKKMIEEAKVNSEHSKTFAENIIKFAPIIVEADKENEDADSD